MENFTVLLSDTQTDLPASAYRSTPEIWGYEVDAPDAVASVPLAIARWHEELGDERQAISIAVVPTRALGNQP